jgi:hypothetical protein
MVLHREAVHSRAAKDDKEGSRRPPRRGGVGPGLRCGLFVVRRRWSIRSGATTSRCARSGSTTSRRPVSQPTKPTLHSSAYTLQDRLVTLRMLLAATDEGFRQAFGAFGNVRSVSLNHGTRTAFVTFENDQQVRAHRHRPLPLCSPWYGRET